MCLMACPATVLHHSAQMRSQMSSQGASILSCKLACLGALAFTVLMLKPAQPPFPRLLRHMLYSIYACPFLLIYMFTQSSR